MRILADGRFLDRRAARPARVARPNQSRFADPLRLCYRTDSRRTDEQPINVLLVVLLVYGSPRGGASEKTRWAAEASVGKPYLKSTSMARSSSYIVNLAEAV